MIACISFLTFAASKAAGYLIDQFFSTANSLNSCLIDQGIMGFTGTESSAKEPKYAIFLQALTYHPGGWRLTSHLFISNVVNAQHAVFSKLC